jgi:hypothetical protein
LLEAVSRRGFPELACPVRPESLSSSQAPSASLRRKAVSILLVSAFARAVPRRFRRCLSFNEADRKILAARLEEIRPLYYRLCGSCGGTCPKGLPDADMLAFLMYAESYGRFPPGRENCQSLAPEFTQVRCTDCEACSVRRPNGVKAAERSIRIQEIFG